MFRVNNMDLFTLKALENNLRMKGEMMLIILILEDLIQIHKEGIMEELPRRSTDRSRGDLQDTHAESACEVSSKHQ